MMKNYINQVNIRLLYASLMLVGIALTEKINAQVLITQNFTGQVATGWTATDVSSSGTNWVFNNPSGRSFPGGTASPGFDGDFAIFDSDHFANQGEEGTLESPTFDASSSVGTYTLDFDNVFRIYSGNENAVVEVWNGTTWVTAYTMAGSAGSNGYPSPNHKTIDITSFTGGSSAAKIRFHYENGNWDYYWAIDNVKVTHLSCIPPAATFAIIPDCANNQFAVNVNISSLGSATSLAIMDGSTLLATATATGTYPLTPFTNASSHIITLVHNVDTACNLAATETYVCPPPNDLCSAAIGITSNITCSPTTGITTGATNSGDSSSCQSLGNSADVWYSFQATHTDHFINVGNVSVTNPNQNDSYYGVSAYSGDCGALNELNCASGELYGTNQSPANLHLTGLTVGAIYYLRVWKGHIYDASYNDIAGDLTFNICVTDPPNPPVNDNCANAIDVPVTNGFSDQAILATLWGATTENGMTTPSCAGGQSDDVWFTVTVPASGNVIVQTSASSATGATDLVMEAYSGTCGALTSVGCNDDGNPDPYPSSYHPRISLTGLTAGAVLHIRVLPYNTSQYKEFAIEAWDSTTLPAITTVGTCVEAPTVTIDGPSGNLYRWVPLQDASGNIIAELYPNGNVLGAVAASTYINTGAVRQSNGVYYLDRNVTITPTNQPSSSVNVRIYSLNQELTALETADVSVTGAGSLNVSKNEDPCSSAVNGATSEYTQSDNAVYGSTGYYVGFATSSFSSFFLRGGTTPLPIFISNISAKNAGTSNEVLWTTAYETAGNYFELERSADGRSFTYLDKITGNGKPSDYVYYDKNPLSGTNYYRIKMVSSNGNITYSKVVEVINGKGSDATIEAFPNPANSNVTLKVYGSGNGDVTLTDIAGKTIYQSKMDGSEMKIDLSALVNGFYLIHYSDGTLNKVIKVNKQ